MITATGYSKDPSLVPEGIVITFGKDMMAANGGQKNVMKYFLDIMAQEEGAWWHKAQRKPLIEVADVYIITLNRLWGRVKFGWYAKQAAFKYSPDDPAEVAWSRIVVVGPFERCPLKRELKGFQGFRYCTKLF